MPCEKILVVDDDLATARIIMQKYHVPAIYLSAETDADTLARTMDTQPLGYVNKPLRESDLAARFLWR